MPDGYGTGDSRHRLPPPQDVQAYRHHACHSPASKPGSRRQVPDNRRSRRQRHRPNNKQRNRYIRSPHRPPDVPVIPAALARRSADCLRPTARIALSRVPICRRMGPYRRRDPELREDCAKAQFGYVRPWPQGRHGSGRSSAALRLRSWHTTRTSPRGRQIDTKALDRDGAARARRHPGWFGSRAAVPGRLRTHQSPARARSQPQILVLKLSLWSPRASPRVIQYIGQKPRKYHGRHRQRAAAPRDVIAPHGLV